MGSLNVEFKLERPADVGGAYAARAGHSDAIAAAAAAAIDAALRGDDAAALAARFEAAASADSAKTLRFLAVEACKSAYIQVPFVANASAGLGAAPKVHGFDAPLWTSGSGCAGPPAKTGVG